MAAKREKDLIFVRALLTARLIKPVVLENRVASLPVNPAHRNEILLLIRPLVREARAKRRSKRKEKSCPRP